MIHPLINKWIKVEDSLPQVNWEKLLYLSSGAISTGYLSKRRPKIEWHIQNYEESLSTVTHWMNLPEDPKL